MFSLKLVLQIKERFVCKTIPHYGYFIEFLKGIDVDIKNYLYRDAYKNKTVISFLNVTSINRQSISYTDYYTEIKIINFLFRSWCLATIYC